MRIILTVILYIFTLSACTDFHHDSIAPIVKSQNDSREYRYMELDNGLKVMLISDPHTDFSAASLDVYAGSSSDPKERQGLAHFLEHMLFLGTEKYPEPNAYDKYLKDNGGHHNAFTSMEHTNYFFDVKPQSLDSTLDRFAQFFISPLLDETYVEREKHAVHSEYKAGIKDESRRDLDALRQVINPEHPLNQFSVGSLETLSSTKTPIKTDLVNFYQNNYVANNMTLAVLGTESLDQLAIMVKDKFSAIKTHTVNHSPITKPLFEPKDLPEVVYVQPEKNLRELSLLFPVPDQIAYYHSQPLNVIGHVLGHEGKGSLLSYLKGKNWVEGLSVSQGLSYNGGGLFSIDISLTEQGLLQKDAVIVAVFQAIKRLQTEGLPRWVFDEIARIDDLKFAFKEDAEPQGYVVSIANDLHYYRPQDVLSAEYILDQYNPTLINDMLQKLTIGNSLIMVVGDKFEPVANTDFYDVPYKVVALDAALKAEIENVAVNVDIQLPEKNTLLPEDLALQEKNKGQDKPALLVKKAGIQLWQKPLQNFQVPKASTYLSFRKENVRATAKDSLLLDLYVDMLTDSFNEWIYSAQMAGLSLQLYGQMRGITLKINGFSDKQDEFLVDTFQHIKNVRFEAVQFERLKAQMLKELQNNEKQVPYKKLMNIWAESLQTTEWPAQQKVAALTSLQLKDVQAYSDAFWQGLDVTVMTNGNITEKQSQKMLLAVEQFIPQQETVKSDVAVVKLPEKNLHKTVASDHEDAGYFLYWQAADNDITNQAKYMLLAKALEADFFRQIRTEQQLGYAVFASYTPLLSVPGVSFVVQSPVASVDKIHQAVMAFLKGAEPGLKALPPEYLLQLQQALRQELLEKPLSLVEESESYWYDLAMGYTGFDRKQQLAQAISAVNIETWQVFIGSLYQGSFSRMFLLSTKTTEIPGFATVDDLKSDKTSQFYHYH